MRDLTQYPISTKEMVEYLEDLKTLILKEDADMLVCGDMRPLLLGEAIRRLLIIDGLARFIAEDLTDK